MAAEATLLKYSLLNMLAANDVDLPVAYASSSEVVPRVSVVVLC
jgi:hypothetical protein